ncbi:TetR/AcrR family transcriptional regulator [Nakamurella deserti]|uniref:TetR/AcrR family transcriptional regulator n=1 Tax=Nakamurella deserti TaxID=2164074 RepID=UPI00197C3F0A|nr:TetR-like C-terminal domain-containing protein [Nakamurella deserti]
MPRAAPRAVRMTLIDTAAAMLAAREPVTLRALATRSGTTTMAVYTHFDGMPGLWRAVRQEGFVRLAARLDAIGESDDPVADLAALSSGYQAAALSAPDLYRAMFDAAADLDDPAVADHGFALLVTATARAVTAHRLDGTTDPGSLATQLWAAGHGLAMLAVTGVLPPAAIPAPAVELVIAVCTAAGDEPARCRRSVTAGWNR